MYHYLQEGTWLMSDRQVWQRGGQQDCSDTESCPPADVHFAPAPSSQHLSHRAARWGGNGQIPIRTGAKRSGILTLPGPDEDDILLRAEPSESGQVGEEGNSHQPSTAMASGLRYELQRGYKTTPLHHHPPFRTGQENHTCLCLAQNHIPQKAAICATAALSRQIVEFFLKLETSQLFYLQW